MCQELGRSGTWSLSDEEIEKMKERLNDFKFQYCINMYNPVWLVLRGGRDEVFKKIKWFENCIRFRGIPYYEDPELRCCGQG